MRRAVVTEAWAASRADPVAVAVGDRVDHDGRRDDWDGHAWVWVAGPDGREGWVPGTVLATDGAGWRAGAAFDAAELTVAAGEAVEVLEATHGWSLCRAADGRRGWVPDRCLRGAAAP